jgi:hypothetical protein
MASQILLLGMDNEDFGSKDNEDFGRSLIVVALGQLFE